MQACRKEALSWFPVVLMAHTGTAQNLDGYGHGTVRDHCVNFASGQYAGGGEISASLRAD